MKKHLWTSYFVTLFLIAGLLGYLIAICPCNTSIGTGILYSLLCYGLLAVSVIYHFHKIAQLKIVYATLLALGFGTIGGGLIFILSEYIIPKGILDILIPNYFMEWFVSCVSVGIISALGIVVVSSIKNKQVQLKTNQP